MHLDLLHLVNPSQNPFQARVRRCQPSLPPCLKIFDRGLDPQLGRSFEGDAIIVEDAEDDRSEVSLVPT